MDAENIWRIGVDFCIITCFSGKLYIYFFGLSFYIYNSQNIPWTLIYILLSCICFLILIGIHHIFYQFLSNDFISPPPPHYNAQRAEGKERVGFPIPEIFRCPCRPSKILEVSQKCHFSLPWSRPRLPPPPPPQRLEFYFSNKKIRKFAEFQYKYITNWCILVSHDDCRER